MREYAIHYQYGTYSGERTVRLDDDDERNPIDVMWARMRNRGELTLPMAHMSAKIIDKKEFDEDADL